MARFGLAVSAAARLPVHFALLLLLVCLAGCGALETELGDLVEPAPGVPVTAPVSKAGPQAVASVQAPARAEVTRPEVTAVSSAVPVPSPVVVRGEAGTSSMPLDLPLAVHRAKISYTGDGPIKVAVSGDGREQVVLEEDDAYEGSVPLTGIPGGSLDTTAAGPWVIEIATLGTEETPAFSGTGDAVSGMFTAESTGPWHITHEGEGRFVAAMRCIAGETIVFDGSGMVNETLEVAIPKNWCYWVVKASGPWSLAPTN